MSQRCVGTWHIRPTPAEFEGRPDLKKTWTGPISSEMYGKGLKDLCNKTEENLTRLSQQMKKMDPCIDYGIKHWHPNARPVSAKPQQIERPKTPGRWKSVEVMFTDNKVLDSLGTHVNVDRDTYVDPPAKKSFCYLCTTLEEHERHMLQHRPKRRPKSAKPRIEYIAPIPRQKVKHSDDEEIVVRERLYKVEVFTSDKMNAGTNANVFVTIKGSQEMLPRTQLKKNRGCSQLCFMRASKEVFHVKGPFLGNLEILTIEHDGVKKNQAWHLDHIEVTDVKVMMTWVFHCGEWISIFEKPFYSNKLDLQAQQKETPLTDYTIEVHTGKQKMAGTDSNIFLTLMGQHGSSKKIHLVDPSSDKKLFERNSVDTFRIRIHGVGELRRVRIEHDGKGFASGWFLEKIIIKDSERPKDTFYFTYGGWIAQDEGDGKLWREIRAKKQLSKEINSAHMGTETRYQITVKTGDVRYAGTDANVFIQLAGEKGITKKLKLDDAKNNFERNMVDNFDLRAINVGAMKHIVIGHDNFGPGAGWFLDNVTVRRYIPKDEARERLHKIKKKLKHEKKKNKKDRKYDSDDELESDTDDEDIDGKSSKKKQKNKKKEKDRSKDRKGSRKEKRDIFSVSSDSENCSEEDSDKEKRSGLPRRPGSAMRRPGSALRRDYRDRDSSDRESSVSRRSGSSRSRDKDSKDKDRYKKDKKSRSESNKRNDSDSDESDENGRKSKSPVFNRSGRRISTSASSLKRQESLNRKGKSKTGDYDDDDLDELKVPLYEECFFECNKWFAADEDDGLSVRELTVTRKQTFYKEKPMH
ncbi:lipoxygenase homology domain-containing protein 1-like isoform X2 [Ruditapes philippinarum]|uniref:lipoxygenase homology domain-containing protein 1-like isoform X2 n=1 Tax=Ruditapes philippinarum TaxID=129788 RepID=UPI00295C09A1|nr:lipoxygenase homology domain-containing protein 1-like isoform X2 [Ruditapes philippinarum]